MSIARNSNLPNHTMPATRSKLGAATLIPAILAVSGVMGQLALAQPAGPRRPTTAQQQQRLNSGQPVVPPAAPPAAPAPAPASNPAAPAPGPTVATTRNEANVPRFRAELNDNRLTITDLSNNRRVFGDVLHPIVRDTPAQAQVRMVAQPDGADLTIELRNTTNRPIALGSIALGGARLAANLTFLRFRHDVEEQTLVNHADMAIGQWPNDIYSPVQLFKDSNYTVGFQLMYPALEYNHPVRCVTIGENWNGRGQAAWTTAFELLGQLPPGEARTYRVAVRIARPDQHWLTTLTPYRDFFQQTYGQVRYTRDARPVMGLPIAFTEFASASNPRGYAGSNVRPDTNGWGPWVTRIQGYLSRTNFRRALIWCPSGVYSNNSIYNFPFKFMTGINDSARSSATFDQLRQLSNNGIEFGFWWGHAARVHRTWDPRSTEELNPNNPEHVRLANLELDMAVRVGAKIIGLDAYVITKPGDAYRWLETMQRRAPSVLFVTEQSASDILHVLAPTFTDAHLVQTPHVMADFLVPGHEVWAGIANYPVPASRRGQQPTNADRDREFDRLAGLGYVPVNYGPTDISMTLQAAESWNSSVPAALQASAPAAQRYRGQSAVAGVRTP